MPRSPASTSLALALLLFAAGCGDLAADEAAGTLADTTLGRPDVSNGLPDVPSGDALATGSDGASAADTTRRDADAASSALGVVKQDDTYLVPGNVIRRSALALGAAGAAWVEHSDDGEPPQIVVWDLEVPGSAPRPLFVANLINPRQLALGQRHLVYVDDRFGDADVFSIDRVTGARSAVVRRPGPQEHPSVAGTEVAWEDCRRCVSGDDGSGREIFRRDLVGGPEVQVTADSVADRRPALGTLTDGARGLAWLRGSDTLRALGSATDLTIDAGVPVASVALTGGVLAWRTQPAIINPDSMRPSDVFFTDTLTRTTTAATFHAELAAQVDHSVRAADGRVAWLESDPADPMRATLGLVSLPGNAQLLSIVEPGITTFALSTSHLAFIAPRADNQGLDDVWIRALP